ncbi:MAG: S8 family serine peptidase, partial [Planctomycetes bacterium]|nr:S8 family serine peptidase [Planctomycetota bacterium]
MLAIAVNLTVSTDPWEDFGLLERAIERAADLSQYTDEQLDATTEWAVAFTGGATAPDVEGVIERGRVMSLQATPIELLSFASDASWQSVASQLESRDDVDYFFPLVGLERSTKFVPNDPYFDSQWHLRNTGQTGGLPGVDANVVPAWDTAQGRGVVIGIVDDGIEFTHPDLSAQYRADLSFDFLDNDNDPSPILANGDFHGTSVAGVAAAAGDNGTGVSGAAPQAELAALRLVSFPLSNDAQEAAALSHERDQIDIYNNSWGPPDDGTTLAPGPLTLQAIQDGINLGRGGLGSIYTWAAGNGLLEFDDSNYDGYANLRYTIG